MKRDDPKVIEARKRNDAAALRAEVIVNGFSAALKNVWINSTEEPGLFIDLLTGPVREAVSAYGEARKAYLKLRPRRRRRA